MNWLKYNCTYSKSFFDANPLPKMKEEDFWSYQKIGEWKRVRIDSHLEIRAEYVIRKDVNIKENRVRRGFKLSLIF